MKRSSGLDPGRPLRRIAPVQTATVHLLPRRRWQTLEVSLVSGVRRTVRCMTEDASWAALEAALAHEAELRALGEARIAQLRQANALKALGRDNEAAELVAEVEREQSR